MTESLVEERARKNLAPPRLSIRIRARAGSRDGVVQKPPGESAATGPHGSGTAAVRRRWRTLQDLPLEIQGLILDYIFGDIHSVASTSSSKPGPTRISSAMRHPRRKALADVTLVSPAWRDLVQERIYRHIKIKGNREGLADSHEWFSENLRLARYVRHVEFWVPLWGDRSLSRQNLGALNMSNHIPATLSTISSLRLNQMSIPMEFPETDIMINPSSNANLSLARNHANQSHRSIYLPQSGSSSATLSEIFLHIACFFSYAKIFTLEGGHCKKSTMIRQFPAALFPSPDRKLEVLPNIRVFAMRGAWNIVRENSHWHTISKALPGLQEWHCAYAKPKPELYVTVNSILNRLPIQVRHLNLSLDGFYCKTGLEGNGTAASSFPYSSSSSLSPDHYPERHHRQHHLCEGLGSVAPQLETLSYTGKICECFFRKAISVAKIRSEVSPLRAIDIVVKSCCRLLAVKKPDRAATEPKEEAATNTQQITISEMDAVAPEVVGGSLTLDFHPASAEISAASDNNIISPQGYLLIPSPNPSDALTSITNMAFIRAFERLTSSAVQSLHPSSFPAVSYIRIRHVDLDSAFPLLNPYFVFKDDSAGPGRCTGVWNNEIIEELLKSRPDALGWDHLYYGIGLGPRMVGDKDGHGDGDGDGDEKDRPIDSLGSGPAGFIFARDRTSSAQTGTASYRKPIAIRGSAYRHLPNAQY